METKSDLEKYIAHFKNIYNGNPWYGDPIMKILEGVGEEVAFAQAAPGKHSIAEILWHMIYWRQLLIKKLQGDSDYQASMQSEDNWRAVEKLRKMGWHNLLSVLAAEQATLVDLLSKQPPDILEKEFKKDAIFDSLIAGIIQHDLYHLGQIAILKNIHLSKEA